MRKPVILGLGVLLALLGGPGGLPAQVDFVRGDSNTDGEVNIVDPVLALGYLFAGESVTCLDALDFDASGVVGLQDAVLSLAYLFDSGSPPSDPFPSCGNGPVMLGCDAFQACGADPLEGLSDPFDGGSIDPSWQVFNPGLVDLSVAGGELHFEPEADTLWFNDNQGPLMWKSVTGSFRMTGGVRARRISNPNLPPSTVGNPRLGGLMARWDTTGGENYLFIVVGSAGQELVVETKDTIDSVSTFERVPWPSAEGELRICRVGDVFELLIREFGSPDWMLIETYVRPDLPDTVQLGLVGYANVSNPDFRLIVEEVDFVTPGPGTACAD